MKIIRLYTGEDGESHFEDIDISLEDGGKIGMLSKLQKATGVIFREKSFLPKIQPATAISAGR